MVFVEAKFGNFLGLAMRGELQGSGIKRSEIEIELNHLVYHVHMKQKQKSDLNPLM